MRGLGLGLVLGLGLWLGLGLLVLGLWLAVKARAGAIPLIAANLCKMQPCREQSAAPYPHPGRCQSSKCTCRIAPSQPRKTGLIESCQM